MHIYVTLPFHLWKDNTQLALQESKAIYLFLRQHSRPMKDHGSRGAIPVCAKVFAQCCNQTKHSTIIRRTPYTNFPCFCFPFVKALLEDLLQLSFSLSWDILLLVIVWFSLLGVFPTILSLLYFTLWIMELLLISCVHYSWHEIIRGRLSSIEEDLVGL